MFLISLKGHVNNVAYVRYAESARVNWIRNYAVHVDPAHKKEWLETVTSKSEGLILRSIRTDYKFVCCRVLFLKSLPWTRDVVFARSDDF